MFRTLDKYKQSADFLLHVARSCRRNCHGQFLTDVFESSMYKYL